MSLTEIQTLLDAHRDEILSGATKADRLESVITLLGQAYPNVPLSAALNGPITDFVAKGNHIEVQPLIDTLRVLKTYDADALAIGNEVSGDLEKIVNHIQIFITENID